MSLKILEACCDTDPKAFFYYLNVFISETHDIKEILLYKFSYKALKKAAENNDTTAKETLETLDGSGKKDKQDFDEWIKNNAKYKQILDHPLTFERNSIKHRGGFAGVHYRPKDYVEIMRADTHKGVVSGNALNPPKIQIVENGKLLETHDIPENHPRGFEYTIWENGRIDGKELPVIATCRDYQKLIFDFVGEVLIAIETRRLSKIS